VPNEDRDGSARWPGVEEAYDFVLPSYQWAITRFEAADSRIQALQVFIVTITIAVTTIGGKDALHSAPVWGALLFATVSVFIGLVARCMGAISVSSPAALFCSEWLSKDPWTFRKDMLSFAGEHFEKNRRLINRKGLAAIVMTGLFALEVVLLLIWVAGVA
jgi:hypothetical protein